MQLHKKLLGRLFLWILHESTFFPRSTSQRLDPHHSHYNLLIGCLGFEWCYQIALLQFHVASRTTVGWGTYQRPALSIIIFLHGTLVVSIIEAACVEIHLERMAEITWFSFPGQTENPAEVSVGQEIRQAVVVPVRLRKQTQKLLRPNVDLAQRTAGIFFGDHLK